MLVSAIGNRQSASKIQNDSNHCKSQIRTDRRPFPGRRPGRVRGRAGRRGEFRRRLPHHALHGNCGALRLARAHRRGHLPSDGRRVGLIDCHRGRGLGRRQGFHGHFRPGIFPDDGAPGLRGHDGDSAGAGGRAARRAFHGLAHPAGAGRHDAGALGIARRLRNHRPVPQLAAGML